MNCKLCIYVDSCKLRDIAPDLTGCDGHSKRKEITYDPHDFVNHKKSDFIKECENRKVNTLKDFSVGDTVIISGSYSTIGTRLPRYIEGSPMKVIGFTKINVKCDYDGGPPFMVPPSLLKKISEG